MAVEEVTIGAGSEEGAEVVGTESAVDKCTGIIGTGLVKDSEACEDWTSIALTSSFPWTATDGVDEVISVAMVVAVGFAMASVLDDEHSEGPLVGSSHCKLPSWIPLQT